jgi:hypothetical protein
VHVTEPLSGGATHTVQLLPHELGLVLVFDTQVRVAPAPHEWKPVLQSTPQLVPPVPVQTGLPFGGSTQAVQPFAVQPEATLLFATHVVGAAAGQPWKVAAQVTLHAFPAQVAVPFVGFAQAVQPLAVQPDAGLLFATQLAFAPVPHR